MTPMRLDTILANLDDEEREVLLDKILSELTLAEITDALTHLWDRRASGAILRLAGPDGCVVVRDAEGGTATLPWGERLSYRDTDGDPVGGVWVGESSGDLYREIERWTEARTVGQRCAEAYAEYRGERDRIDDEIRAEGLQVVDGEE